AALEEGRAQALHQLLAERRQLTEQVVKPELWRPYQEALFAQNQAYKQLERAQQEEQHAQGALARVEAAQAAYTAARLNTQARWAERKAGSPAVFPEAVSLAEARSALPEGTLFCAFSVGEKESTLFLVARVGPVLAY